MLGVTYKELFASIVRDEKMLEKCIVMAEALEQYEEADLLYTIYSHLTIADLVHSPKLVVTVQHPSMNMGTGDGCFCVGRGLVGKSRCTFVWRNKRGFDIVC